MVENGIMTYGKSMADVCTDCNLLFIWCFTFVIVKNLFSSFINTFLL